MGLRLGPYVVDPPVVLAPMAGITNSAFRRLCREFGAGLYVSEMVTCRALLERNEETLRMLRFAPEERPRSVQLYGVDPATVGAAVRLVVAEDLADHVDLNFGCPVPKVTRKGGGAALPYRRGLLRDIVRAAVRAADGQVPVTMKMRKGIDGEHLTFLDAGRIAEDEGCAWVALHARTAEQMYSGAADWAAVARLREALSIPVLGNGDIWAAGDAVRLMAQTGCHGVVVGRGCLGRPWLFRDLAAAFRGEPAPTQPDLREVVQVLRRHVGLLAEIFGEEKACREIRKHVAWYLKGFVVGSGQRERLGRVSSIGELDGLLAALDLDQRSPEVVLSSPRGRTTGRRRVALPEGWLGDPASRDVPMAAEIGPSGG